jgi:hypothetical protein
MVLWAGAAATPISTHRPGASFPPLRISPITLSTRPFSTRTVSIFISIGVLRNSCRKSFWRGSSATSSTKLSATAAPARGPAEQLRQQPRGTMTRDLVGRDLTPVTAQAGNLDTGVTTHWLSAHELRQAYPKVKMEEDRTFIVEDAVWTSAGRPTPGWVEFSGGSRPQRAPSIKRPEPLTVIV